MKSITLKSKSKLDRRIPDQGIDLDSVNIIQLLQCLLYLLLVCTDIADEDQSVVFLDLLHGALSVERVDDDFVLIKARFAGNRLSRVFGSARQLESLGPVEGSRSSDLTDLVRMDLRNVLAAFNY